MPQEQIGEQPEGDVGRAEQRERPEHRADRASAPGLAQGQERVEGDDDGDAGDGDVERTVADRINSLIVTMEPHQERMPDGGPVLEVRHLTARRAADVRAIIDAAERIQGSVVVDTLARSVCETSLQVTSASRSAFVAWDAASGTEVGDLMAAAVVSDSTGHYRVPALARGYDYTVMVAAEGYRPAVFDAGLTVEPDAPALKEMDPVELEPSIW